MITDGLIKALLLDDHCWFLDQLDLIDIWDRLMDCQNQEAAAFDPPGADEYWLSEADFVSLSTLIKL